MPGFDRVERIHAHDVKKLILRKNRLKMLQRVQRVRRMRALALESRNLKHRILCDSQLRHGEAMVIRRHVRLVLVRRNIRRNEQHLIQRHMIAKLTDHVDMSQMDGIKRAAEQSYFHRLSSSLTGDRDYLCG